MLAAWTASLPRWLHIGLAGILAAIAFLLWLDHYGDKRVEEHEAGINTELNVKASGAAAEASEAARDTKAGIDAETQRGMAAASGSADPLRDAFKEW